jgi:hypothetical protein
MRSLHCPHTGLLLLAFLFTIDGHQVATPGHAETADTQRAATPVAALPNKDGSFNSASSATLGLGPAPSISSRTRW